MSIDIYADLPTYLSWLFSNLFGAAQPHLHFWFFSFVTLASAIGVVTARNLIHSAMLLALCLISVAAIFIILNAEVLAAIQIIVYVAGVVTLIIFAIMLSESISGKKVLAHNRQSISALGVAILMAIIMTIILMYNREGQYVGPLRWWLPPERRDFPSIDNAHLVGTSLMTTYVLGFWIASIILMIAMIGALIIARAEKDMPGGEVSQEAGDIVSKQGEVNE